MNATKQQVLIAISLVAAWFAFAAWQYHEFGRERKREQSDLIQQSDVLRQALLGGVRAHRRLGRVFEEQMQGVIDELTTTPGVEAIRISDPSERIFLEAGKISALEATDQSPLWQSRGLQTSEQAEFSMMAPGPGGSGGGPAWMREAGGDGRFVQLRLTLLMDRTATDEAIRAAARQRVTVALAGIAVLATAAVAWAATIRAIRARSEAQLLESETQRLEELGQAASGLAHETRNPLGVIRGGLQQLSRKGDSTSEHGPGMQLLIEECDRVTARINQFLAYARPRSADLESVALRPLFEELQTLLQPDLEVRQLTLQVAPTDTVILADPNLLRQVLFNLLQNAITFSSQGKAIDVRVERRQARIASIVVADRGPGVAADQVPRLFSPYNTTCADGTGLGLAIVKRLAMEQGWSVRYEARPEGGATFLIEDIRVATDSPNLSR